MAGVEKSSTRSGQEDGQHNDDMMQMLANFGIREDEGSNGDALSDLVECLVAAPKEIKSGR